METGSGDAQRFALPCHRPDRTVLRDEGELHVASLAKKAAAFLRNSHLGACRCGLENEPKGLGPTLQISDHSSPISDLVGGGTWIDVVHAVAERIVEKTAILRAVAVTALALPTRADSLR